MQRLVLVDKLVQKQCTLVVSFPCFVCVSCLVVKTERFDLIQENILRFNQHFLGYIKQGWFPENYFVVSETHFYSMLAKALSLTSVHKL